MKRMHLPCILLVLAMPAQAATIFSDGQPHSVISPSGGIVLINRGTSLAGHDGANVVGAKAPRQFDQAEAAIRAEAGTLVKIDGGSYTGGNSYPGDLVRSGNALELVGGSAVVSGGVFTGGVGREPGYAVAQLVSRGSPLEGTLTITGGTFFAGPGIFQGAASAAIINGNARIAGGTFVPSSSNPFALQFSTASFAHLTIEGGTFMGLLAFDNISGPLYEPKNGYVDVLGTGLAFVGDRLTGTLLDGSPINTLVSGSPNIVPTFVSSTRIRFGIELVPEPSSLSLGVIGLVLLATARRWIAAVC